ncbi:hypothetical protein AMECASPLE_031257 [Ameca splendens]|uniref:AMP-dependent synthetase/ligase domain-containing protein n=1 Tax=Ameca splendens TaxID=208324 RepID=A0ABV1AF90_9TELE
MSSPYAIVKYDTEKEEPVRNSKGFCIQVPKGETGLLVAKIGKRTPFSGYAKNKEQTEKKKLRDVFARGDLYFNSGDLLRIDSEGFVYFQDRIGDTFRRTSGLGGGTQEWLKKKRAGSKNIRSKLL